MDLKHLVWALQQDLAKDEIKIKNNKTKEEELVSVDYLLYYLDEHLSEEDYDDYEIDEECHCEHHHDEEHECHCGHKNCHCNEEE